MIFKTYLDTNGNKLEFYINSNGLLYIDVSQVDEPNLSGYITLTKDDVKNLIKDLQQQFNSMV